MHYLVVSCVFPPEPVVTARTSDEITRALCISANRVKVITTFPNRPAGKLYSGYSRQLYETEKTQDGYTLVRCFSLLSSESSVLSRFLENISFGLTSGWQVLTSAQPDVIYANTWPIMATGILFLIAKLRRVPLVISVQDIYPEALIAQQRFPGNSLLNRWMCWIDGYIARHSSHVIVISDNFAEIYRNQRCVPSHRLSIIPNWIDSNLIDISISKQKFRQSKGIHKDDFLIVYGGNIGVAADVESVIEAMRLLGNDKRIKLLIAGAGSQLAACQKLASTIANNSIFFHSPWHLEETSEVLRAADLLVLPTQKNQSLTSVPSKLLSYMLAERPIVATALPDSDLVQVIERSQCGWVTEPDRPAQLAETIREITQLEPEELDQRGKKGRQFVLENFSKDACLSKVIQILKNATQPQ